MNRKRPGEPSDDFMLGKGAKWSKSEALPAWNRDLTEDGTAIKWKSPRFMVKAARRGAMRVKSILKKVSVILYKSEANDNRKNGRGSRRMRRCLGVFVNHL